MAMGIAESIIAPMVRKKWSGFSFLIDLKKAALPNKFYTGRQTAGACERPVRWGHRNEEGETSN